MPLHPDLPHIEIPCEAYDADEGLPNLTVSISTTKPANLIFWSETEDGETSIELAPAAQEQLRDLLTASLSRKGTPK